MRVRQVRRVLNEGQVALVTRYKAKGKPRRRAAKETRGAQGPAKPPLSCRRDPVCLLCGKKTDTLADPAPVGLVRRALDWVNPKEMCLPCF